MAETVAKQAEGAGPPSVVWVLGAGFSKPLGGPLLNELLSPRYVAIAQGLVDREARASLASVAGAFHLLRQMGLVDDAEDFLNVLDTACDTDDNPQAEQCRSLLRQLYGQSATLLGMNFDYYEDDSFGDLRTAARLQIAAACESFVPFDRNRQNPENWAPYTHWAQRLVEPQDTIVTFNYDRAIEWAAQERVSCVLPALDQRLKEQELNQGSARLLKLHGSVSWTLEGDNRVEKHDPAQVRELLKSPEHTAKLVIGVPGPAKSTLSTRVLTPLWEMARDALERASAVVLVGYRMPDTDGHAMELIMNGLRNNAARGAKLTFVHLVLGPNIESDDMQRLHGYFSNIVGKSECVRQRAYAQGFFLSLKDRRSLYT